MTTALLMISKPDFYISNISFSLKNIYNNNILGCYYGIAVSEASIWHGEG